MRKVIFTILLLLITVISCSNDRNSNSPPSPQVDITAKDITSFSFEGLSTEATGDFNDTEISVLVPIDCDVSSLIAAFSTTGKKVEVNGLEQANGVTVNNFSLPLIYVVTAIDGTMKEYTVGVTYVESLRAFQYITERAVYYLTEEIEVNKPVIGSGRADHFEVSPQLPDGLFIDSSTGYIYGTPEVYFENSRKYTITASNPQESITAEFFISKIYPPSPHISWSNDVVIVYVGESVDIALENDGGPIEEFEINDDHLPEGLSYDHYLNKITGTPLYDTYNPYVPARKYNSKKLIIAEASNFRGESKAILSISVYSNEKYYTGKYLNIQEMFENIEGFPGDEVITESLYDVTNAETKAKSSKFLIESYLQNLFTSGSGNFSDIERAQWLSEFKYRFIQTADSVYVYKLFTEDNIRYSIDEFESGSIPVEEGSKYIEKKLVINKEDDAQDYPPYMEFKYVHWQDDEHKNLQDYLLISIQDPDEFSITGTCNGVEYFESRPVIVTKGINYISYFEGYHTGGAPAISDSMISLFYSLLHFDSEADEEAFDRQCFCPYIGQ